MPLHGLVLDRVGKFHAGIRMSVWRIFLQDIEGISIYPGTNIFFLSCRVSTDPGKARLYAVV